MQCSLLSLLLNKVSHANLERNCDCKAHNTSSHAAIEKAQRVLAQYKAATEAGKGAYGLAADKDGKAEMIDAPMILQAQRVLAKAAQYGLV